MMVAGARWWPWYILGTEATPAPVYGLGASVSAGEGFAPLFTRLPRWLSQSFSQLRPPAKAQAVFNDIIPYLLGPDERYRLSGVPLAIRTIALKLRCGTTRVQEGMTWLLEQNVLIRKPDPSRRNAYLYQLVHPEHWLQAELLLPRPRGQLEPDVLPEWPLPLFRFAPGTRPKLIDNLSPRVLSREHTHAGAPSQDKKNLNTENSQNHKLITLYVYHNGQQIPLVDAVSNLLDMLVPGWESIGKLAEKQIAAGLVLDMQNAIHQRYDYKDICSTTWVRRAIAEATERTALRQAEREEVDRRAAIAFEHNLQIEAQKLLGQWTALEREIQAVCPELPEVGQALKIEAGKFVAVEESWRIRWEGLTPEAQADCLGFAEAVQAISRINAGNFLEIEVASILVGQVEAYLQGLQVGRPWPVPLQKARVEAVKSKDEVPDAVAQETVESASLEDIQARLLILKELSAQPSPLKGAQTYKIWGQAMTTWTQQVQFGRKARDLLNETPGVCWLQRAQALLADAPNLLQQENQSPLAPLKQFEQVPEVITQVFEPKLSSPVENENIAIELAQTAITPSSSSGGTSLPPSTPNLPSNGPEPMTATSIRAAFYARVSTNHHQDIGLQLDELRSVAAQRGWVVFDEYVDDGISGAKTSRPGVDRMLADAQAGRFDLLVVWKLDRLARSVIHLLEITESLRQWSVGLVSLRDAHVDTTTLSGRFTLQILGAVAELERGMIQERVIAGVRRAQAAGKHCGRPLKEVDLRPALALLKEGRSLKETAAILRVNRNTLRRRLREDGGWPMQRTVA